jgi:tetratricopeptide (TPR) repeat protein
MCATFICVVSLTGCGTNRAVRNIEFDGVGVEAVKSDRFRLYGEKPDLSDPTIKALADKLCGTYNLVPAQEKKTDAVEIECTVHVFNKYEQNGSTSFVPDMASEYVVRASLDHGGAPFDIFEFPDANPITRILFYNRGDKIHPVLLALDNSRILYRYQAIWTWDVNEFNKIFKTPLYKNACKNWYGDNLLQKAQASKKDGKQDEFIMLLGRLEKVTPLSISALSALGEAYADGSLGGKKDVARALELAKKAVEQERTPASLIFLADMQAESGNFKKAIEIGEQAYGLANDESTKVKVGIYVDNYKAGKAPSVVSESDWASYAYAKGVALAEQGKTKIAIELMNEANRQVPNYKDTSVLLDKYKRILSEGEAESHYQTGVKLLKESKFQEASAEFSKAQQIVPNFKDSQKLGEEARNAMPSKEQLTQAVAKALGSQVPVSWVGNLMGGSLQGLDDVQVERIGIYNKEKKYWPMKIRCVGTAALNDMFNKGVVKKFDKVAEFVVFKDDYGDWQAEMKGSMLQ